MIQEHIDLNFLKRTTPQPMCSKQITKFANSFNFAFSSEAIFGQLYFLTKFRFHDPYMLCHFLLFCSSLEEVHFNFAYGEFCQITYLFDKGSRLVDPQSASNLCQHKQTYSLFLDLSLVLVLSTISLLLSPVLSAVFSMFVVAMFSQYFDCSTTTFVKSIQFLTRQNHPCRDS